MIDTDVCVDALRGRSAAPTFGSSVAYSIITRCELLAGRPQGHDAVRELLSSMRELPLDRVVAERAGSVRREAGIATPDALIAATALVHEMPLLTRNRRHFERVEGLEVIVP